MSQDTRPPLGKAVEFLSALYITWAFSPLVTRSVPNVAVLGVISLWFVSAGLSFRDFLSLRLPRLLLLVSGFVLVMIISYLRVDSIVEPGNLLLGVIYFFPVCMYLYFTSTGQRGALIRLVNYSLAIASLTAVTNILILQVDPFASKYLSGSVLTSLDNYSNTNLATVTWVMASTVLVPALIGYAGSTKSAITRVLLVGIATLHGLFVVYAASSTATILLLAALIVATVRVLWARPLHFYGYLLGAVILVLVMRDVVTSFYYSLDSAGLYSSRMIEIAEYLSPNQTGEGSWTARLADMEISVNSFLSTPLIGIGMVYGKDPQSIGIGMHSQVVDDLARYGLIGAALLLAIYTAIVKLSLDASDKSLRFYIGLCFGTALVLSVLNPTMSACFGIVLFLILPSIGCRASLTSGGLDP